MSRFRSTPPHRPLPENLRNAQREDFVIPGFQEPWPAGTGKWIEIVNRLAAGIKDALQNLRRRAGAVFVGPTLSTAMELRANLVDYLSEQHFRATPDPIALLEDRKACQSALTESACAVHFVGGATEDALQSIEDSINSCSGPTIVFQPFGAKLSAAEEQVLADLPPDRHLHRINANEIELRKFLEELLTTYRQAAVPAVPASLGLVCDLTDLSWAQAFRADGLSVDYPRFLFDKNLGNLERLRHWKQLVQSHGLLFYHGQSAETMLDRIRRLAHEEKSQAIQRWYLDQPDVDKKRPTHPDDPVYPEDLEPFLDQVRRRAEGK